MGIMRKKSETLDQGIQSLEKTEKKMMGYTGISFISQITFK